MGKSEHTEECAFIVSGSRRKTAYAVGNELKKRGGGECLLVYCVPEGVNPEGTMGKSLLEGGETN